MQSHHPEAYPTAQRLVATHGPDQAWLQAMDMLECCAFALDWSGMKLYEAVLRQLIGLAMPPPKH